jgi:hypothetical protein
LRNGLVNWWADRAHWAANLLWWVEGLHRMTGERFDRVAGFLDRAVGAAQKPTQ